MCELIYPYLGSPGPVMGTIPGHRRDNGITTSRFVGSWREQLCYRSQTRGTNFQFSVRVFDLLSRLCYPVR